MVIVITVCKIIGIVVLALVAILAVVLFLPISYEVDADIDRQRYRVRVNWLFRLIRFRFLYNEKAEMTLSVLFIKIDFLDKEKKNARKKKKADKKKKKADEDAEQDQGMLAKAAGFAGAAVHVCSLMNEYNLLDAVWPGLQIFLFRVRPRQIRGQLEFGFSDPAATGQIVGVLALLPFIYQTDLQMVPDFETEERYIRGNIYLCGRLMLIYAVVFLIRLIRQKNVRSFIGGLRGKTSKKQDKD
ncbi:MAG: hypothetical protein LUD14_07480 [Clostridiales bacterium]|nr:hypothetical protein [Clostridiales bacterium]